MTKFQFQSISSIPSFVEAFLAASPRSGQLLKRRDLYLEVSNALQCHLHAGRIRYTIGVLVSREICDSPGVVEEITY